MLPVDEAFWIGLLTYEVRSYGTRTLLANLLTGSPDRATWDAGVLAGRRADRTWERAGPALKRIEALLARNGLAPPAEPTAQASGPWASGLYALAKGNVATGSAAAAALDLGAFAADLETAVGAVADFAEIGSFGTANAQLRAEGDRRTASLEAALYCLDETLGQVGPLLRSAGLSPSVGEGLETLTTHLAKRPAAESGGLGSWLSTLQERLRALGVALSFPPEPARLDPPSAEERAVVASILADPAAAAPRQAFAELAGRRGDPRGAFVREQLATTARRRSLRMSLADSELARDLLRRHPEWSDEVRRLGAVDVRFVRGFVEEITIDAGLFLENGAALFGTAPLRSARLTGVAPRLQALAGSPLLGRLAGLGLAEERLGDRDVATLAESPHVRGLLSLDLSGNQVTGAGLRTLAASPNLAGLRQCVIAGNPCGRLYESDWSRDENPIQEWVPTELLTSLEAAHGTRRWFRPPERVLGLDELD